MQGTKYDLKTFSHNMEWRNDSRCSRVLLMIIRVESAHCEVGKNVYKGLDHADNELKQKGILNMVKCKVMNVTIKNAHFDATLNA